jgi:PAS domain S-box-containing protein
LVIAQDGRYVFCSDKFAEILGYSVEELLSLSPEEMPSLIYIDDREFATKSYEDRLAGKPISPRQEFRCVKKDSSVIWVEIYSSLINYHGKPALQAAFMDISDLKKAELALRESEERFRLIAETIDEVFWIWDAQTDKAIYISPAFERIWGIRQRACTIVLNPFLNIFIRMTENVWGRRKGFWRPTAFQIASIELSNPTDRFGKCGIAVSRFPMRMERSRNSLEWARTLRSEDAQKRSSENLGNILIKLSIRSAIPFL